MPDAWKWSSNSHSGAANWRGTLEGEHGPVDVKLRYGVEPDDESAPEYFPLPQGRPPVELASQAVRICGRPARVWATWSHDPGHEGVETVCVAPSDSVVFSLELRVSERVSATLERREERTDGVRPELPPSWPSVLVTAAEFLLAWTEPLAVRKRASQRVTLQVQAPVAGVSAQRERGGLQSLVVSTQPRGSLRVGLHAERLERVVHLDRIEQEWRDDPGRRVSLALPHWAGQGQSREQVTGAQGRATLSLRLRSPMSGLLVAHGYSSRGASACFEIVLRWGREIEAHLGPTWPRADLPDALDPDALRAICSANLVASYHPDWHAFREWSPWAQTLVGLAVHRRPRADADWFAQDAAEVAKPIDGWLLGLLPEPKEPAPAALWRSCTAVKGEGSLRDLSPATPTLGGEPPTGEWRRGEVWPLVDALHAGVTPDAEGLRALADRIEARPAPFSHSLSKLLAGWEPDPDPVFTQSLAAAVMVRLGEPGAATALLDAIPPDTGRFFDEHGTRFHALAAYRLAVEAGLGGFRAHYEARRTSIWAALRAQRHAEFTADALLFLAALRPGFLAYF